MISCLQNHHNFRQICISRTQRQFSEDGFYWLSECYFNLCLPDPDPDPVTKRKLSSVLDKVSVKGPVYLCVTVFSMFCYNFISAQAVNDENANVE